MTKKKIIIISSCIAGLIVIILIVFLISIDNKPNHQENVYMTPQTRAERIHRWRGW